MTREEFLEYLNTENERRFIETLSLTKIVKALTENLKALEEDNKNKTRTINDLKEQVDYLWNRVRYSDPAL